MKMISGRYWIGAMLAVLLMGIAQDVNAMPAFSRKYKTSCMTCHEAPPRLNAVGDAYRLNGYRFKDDERYRKEEPVELGEEAYKRLWPEALYPNEMPMNIPLSLVTRWIVEIDANTQVNPETEEAEAGLTFVLPHEFEIALGAPIGEHITLYGDMIFVQEDFGTDDISSWLSFKAWIEFQDLIGPENAFNIRVGTVGMHTIGLYTARDEQRMGIQPYTMNSWKMPGLELAPGGGFSQSPRIKDFETNSFVIQPQVGIEVNGFGNRWLYYAGVVNGSIENPINQEPKDNLFALGYGENTEHKDFYVGLAYKFGGLGFDGAGDEGFNPLKDRPQSWRDDDSLTVSAFGYMGHGLASDAIWDVSQPAWGGAHTKTDYDDPFLRVGAGALKKYKDLTLNVGYMYSYNDDPYGPYANIKVSTDSWFVETYYFWKPWLIPYARYDFLEFEGLPDYQHNATNALKLAGEQDRQILFLGCKALIRANISLQVEGTIYTRDYDYEYFGLDETIFFQMIAAF
ncbi:hypothetical protein ACFL03_12475 [Thermodesulfobacteriota bacterium]